MSSHCPICYTKLVVKECTPCMDCGGNHTKLDQDKEYTYVEYEIIDNQRLTLCNFCAVDFGSYNPTALGLNKRIGFENFNFVKSIKNKHLQLDKYCPECNHRLPFLEFIAKNQEKNKL